jgi:hypothetical protein
MDALQPIDLLVAFKLAALGDANLPVREIEAALGISKSAAAKSMNRLAALKIIRPAEGGRRINRFAFCDLVQHGTRWIAPAEVGDYELGLLTSHGAEPIASHLMGSDEDPLVMPLPHGPARGRAVSPIHPLAPAAAAKDERLYRLLVMADAFRVGRARERQIAAEEMRKWV